MAHKGVTRPRPTNEEIISELRRQEREIDRVVEVLETLQQEQEQEAN